MVASRDILEGEVIMKEYPLTFGPGDESAPLCLGCYIPLTQKTCISCERCGFPMCSKECSEILTHKSNECDLVQKSGRKINLNKDISWTSPYDLIYSTISPIRAFKMKDRDPYEWNLVWSHMSHHKSRKESKYWTSKTESVMNKIKEIVKCSKEDSEIFEIILGIFLVNDFEIPILTSELNDSSMSIRALFALASIPSHSCMANCVHTFSDQKDGFSITVTAATFIQKGSEITHYYTDPLESIITRRSILQVGKFFLCDCVRCLDPSDMGTNFSSLRCRKCKTGLLNASDPSIIDSKWTCNICSYYKTTQEVQSIIDKFKLQLENLEKLPTIKSYEDFLSKNSEILHSNHAIFINVSYNLAKMYGRMEGYEINSLTPQELLRKKDLCYQVLEILNNLTFGQTKMKAMMMYELHLPLVILSNQDLSNYPKSKSQSKQILKNLKDALLYLKQSLNVFEKEPSMSFEYQTFLASKNSVSELSNWINTVQKQLK